MKDLLLIINADMCDRAFAAVNAINKSSAKWLVRLMDVCEEVYGVRRVLFAVCKTRWNSAQMVLARLLSLRTACAVMADRYSDELPESMKCFKCALFWSSIETAHGMLLPLCRASLLLEAHGTRMSDVVYYLYAIYHSLGNSVCAVSAQELVEKRFIQCEVPLMILAFVLDPKYIHIVEGFLEWQETQNSMFSIKYLAQAAQAYYVKLFFREYDSVPLRKQSKLVRRGVDKYLNLVLEGHFLDQEEDCMEFWGERELEDITGTPLQPTADLACRLLSVAAQSADNERLFKRIGFHKSERRNRLTNKRAMDCVVVQKELKDRRDHAGEEPRKKKQRIVSSKELRAIMGADHNVIRRIQVCIVIFTLQL